MKLFHFTSLEFWARIEQEGINGGALWWPNPNGSGYLKLLDCQWLTDEPDWGAQRWATMLDHHRDRTAVRIPIKFPPRELVEARLVRWRVAAAALKLHPRNVAEFEAAGGNGGEHWWVYLRPIPRQWLRVPTVRPDIVPLPMAPGIANDLGDAA